MIGYPLIKHDYEAGSSGGKFLGKKSRKSIEPNVVSAGTAISIFVGAVMGAVIALPPFVADSKLRSSLNKSDADGVKAQALVFPVDSLRVNKAAFALARGGMTQSAREVAQVAILKYPDDFAGWFLLYELTPAADTQRTVIKAKLHEIDPLNSEWK